MELMQSHGIGTPPGFVATTPQEAEDAFVNKLNTRKYGRVITLSPYLNLTTFAVFRRTLFFVSTRNQTSDPLQHVHKYI